MMTIGGDVVGFVIHDNCEVMPSLMIVYDKGDGPQGYHAIFWQEQGPLNSFAFLAGWSIQARAKDGMVCVYI